MRGVGVVSSAFDLFYSKCLGSAASVHLSPTDSGDFPGLGRNLLFLEGPLKSATLCHFCVFLAPSRNSVVKSRKCSSLSPVPSAHPRQTSLCEGKTGTSPWIGFVLEQMLRYSSSREASDGQKWRMNSSNTPGKPLKSQGLNGEGFSQAGKLSSGRKDGMFVLHMCRLED